MTLFILKIIINKILYLINNHKYLLNQFIPKKKNIYIHVDIYFLYIIIMEK